nr:hypothetical protein [Tanacetum cinerariifolium]
MLVSQGKGSGTPTEPHHTPSLVVQTPSHTTQPTSSLPPVSTTSIPTVTPTKTTPIRQYTRRARIAQSSALLPVADEHASPVRDSSTLPHDSTPRVTSPVADKGNDAPIKGRSMDEGEAATERISAERISDDTVEMATVLTFIDAATVLAGGINDVSTGSGSIPTASPPAADIPTDSDVVPTASLVFTTATVIDAQVASQLEEQLEREDKRMSEQIARDAEVARIYAKEELQSMIDGLDRNNETIAKYLQEYQQFAAELALERRIELISDLVKYQENYAKIYKFQSQQRRSWTKKQKRDYYMAVIKNNLGWKVKDFNGITFEEVEAKFNSVYKQMEDFIPMGSKEEAKRYKKRLIPIEEVYVEALQIKHSIIDWKHLDREDLNQLWILVKEYLSIRPASSDKEIELWVELKRLYEPDPEDQQWAQTHNFMHAPIEWKLYDLSGVHQVTAKDKEIFMLVEKDYPLRKGLSLLMICYKLQVENFSQMANDLVLKIYKIANSPRQQGD